MKKQSDSSEDCGVEREIRVTSALQSLRRWAVLEWKLLPDARTVYLDAVPGGGSLTGGSTSRWSPSYASWFRLRLLDGNSAEVAFKCLSKIPPVVCDPPVLEDFLEFYFSLRTMLLSNFWGVLQVSEGYVS